MHPHLNLFFLGTIPSINSPGSTFLVPPPPINTVFYSARFSFYVATTPSKKYNFYIQADGKSLAFD